MTPNRKRGFGCEKRLERFASVALVELMRSGFWAEARAAADQEYDSAEDAEEAKARREEYADNELADRAYSIARCMAENHETFAEELRYGSA